MSEKNIFSDYKIRSGLKNCYQYFSDERKGRIAFMGGSVTTRSWRVKICDFLEKMFPETEFQFINAGLGGTDANLGAFRLPSEVFGNGSVELFFLEFAVNGGGIRAMEGIVRQAKRLNPEIDICILYFANTSHVKDFNENRIPQIIQNHERVAKHYRVPSLFLYREVARRIDAGEFTWGQFSSDVVHPTELGNEIYAKCIKDFLRGAWRDSVSKAPIRELPLPLEPFCYERGRFLKLDAAEDVQGWNKIPEWTTDKHCNWRPPADVLVAEETGATLKLAFHGTAIGIYTLIGMDTGTIDYSIDGSPFETVDPFDDWCLKFHRPQYTIFADELSKEQHEIILRTGKQKNSQSKGYSTRILKFMAN